MIDLHSHVLPGIDDGPRDLGGSIAMAEAAADAGTTWLVATPHLREDHPAVKAHELSGRVAELNQALQRRGSRLRVLPGAEVDLTTGLELSDAELRAATLGGGGRDLLVESPYGPLPSVFESLLGALASRGFRVTLAHPELNPSFQADPGRLQRLAGDGVLIQLTVRSLRTRRRSPAHELALTAVRGGWAHVLASDSHSSDWRPPNLGPEVRALAEEQPGSAARWRWMIEDAPRAILAGEALPPAPELSSVPGSRRGLLRRLSGHAR